jgi:hypothetical protein
MDADIETLHRIYVERFKKLIQEANRTCGLLDVSEFPTHVPGGLNYGLL